MNLGKFEWILEEATRLAVQLGLAIIIFVVGFWIASHLKKIIRNRMIKRKMEPTIREFLIPILDFLLKLMVVMMAISTVGIKVTSFAAILAGLAAGIGLSLQGSLSNFAGGLLIVFFKPFKVGDQIEALGQSGTVESISILYTTIVGGNQQVITLPNASLLNNPIVNLSIKPTRRLDINLSLAFTEDLDKALEVLKNMLKDESFIVKDTESTVEVLSFADNKINVVVRAFVNRDDYWDAYFKLYKRTYHVLEENHISIYNSVSQVQPPKK